MVTLLNSKVLIKLRDEEKEKFKRLILFGLEECPKIYKINFNTANITNQFLDDILQVLGRRSVRIGNSDTLTLRATTWRSDIDDDAVFFGPELLFLENNPIFE